VVFQVVSEHCGVEYRHYIFQFEVAKVPERAHAHRHDLGQTRRQKPKEEDAKDSQQRAVSADAEDVLKIDVLLLLLGCYPGPHSVIRCRD